MIGRFLMGIGNGGHSVVVYMYISEYSHNSIRGTMISMVMFAYSAGIIVSYIFRYFFSFEVINYIILMLCVSYIGLMSFLKETPAYLLSRGQHQEALKSLKFYRGTLKITFDIVEEMSYVWSKRYPNLIQKDSETSNEIFERQKSNENYDEKAKDVEVKPWKTLLSTISMRRAIVMITLHVMLVTFTETMAVQSYAGPLFIQAAPTFASHAYSIVLAISVLLGCGVSSMINNMIGRRTLMMLSLTASTLCLAAIYSMLKWSYAPTWAMSAFVILFCFSFHIGATNVPFIQLGESFVFEVKSAASVTAVCGMWASNIVAVAVFGPAVELLGLDGTFLVISMAAALTTIISYLFMKETKDVPVEYIQEMYEQGYLYNSKVYARPSTSVN